MKLPGDLRRRARAVKGAGWVIVQTGGGHLAWIALSGLVLSTPGGPVGQQPPAQIVPRRADGLGPMVHKWYTQAFRPLLTCAIIHLTTR